MGVVGIVLLVIALKIGMGIVHSSLGTALTAYHETNRWFHEEVLRSAGYSFGYELEPMNVYNFKAKNHVEYLVGGGIIIAFLLFVAFYVCHADVFIIDMIKNLQKYHLFSAILSSMKYLVR